MQKVRRRGRRGISPIRQRGKVYWRRRAMVEHIIGVGIVLLLVFLYFVGGG